MAELKVSTLKDKGVGVGIDGKIVPMSMWIFEDVIRKWITKYFQLVYLKVTV